MEKERIRSLTEQLLNFTIMADDIYEEARRTGKEKDFFTEVKPFADEVMAKCAEWERGLMKWMKEEEFRHLFPQQIEQTARNLSDVAVQAFFPKTSYKRFKSHIQSTVFIIRNVEAEINRLLS